MMLPTLSLSIWALTVGLVSAAQLAPRAVVAVGEKVGDAAVPFQENPANKFKPVQGFDANRLAFYRYERSVAAAENAKLRQIRPDGLRIGHFDAHWHGLTVQEYLALQEATHSHILVARGVPEKEGYVTAVRQRLQAAGFDATSVVEGPCASLTSGMVIGVRQGITVEEHRFISHEGRHVALEAVVRISPHVEPLHLLALSLDANESASRVRQLRLVSRRLQALQSSAASYLVLGGFWGHVRYSEEVRALEVEGVKAKEAFFAAQRRGPLYTSWTGDFTDTCFVSESLAAVVKDAQIWHAEVDCLPILVDLDLKVKMALITPAPDRQTSGKCSGRTAGITVFFSRYWKHLLGMLAALLAAVGLAVGATLFLKRRPSRAGRPIQATGSKHMEVDPDAKLKSQSSPADHQQQRRVEEVYEDEKK